jgi:glycosyltransferase involved in cell wall biosynthesis
VIPYFRMHAFVEEAVRSALAQSHRRVEVIVVNDGSLEREDRVLERLAEHLGVRVFTQHNQGLGAARNAGIDHARGRYVLPLDPDDILEPTFVERTLAALAEDPRLAYATTWSTYVDEDNRPLGGGYQPIGNELRDLLAHGNVAGAATALIPTAIFHTGFAYREDLSSFEDWDLYARLADAGRFGCVVPERLFRYRVRRDSMLRSTAEQRRGRLQGELTARRKEGAITWTCRNA